LLSSAWVNGLELVLLLAGFILAVPYALAAAGGWGALHATIAARTPELGPGYSSPFGIGAAGVLHYFALLAPSFVVSPGLIQKIYGARSARAARAGVNWNAAALLLFACIPPLLGIVARARFTLGDPQLALPRVMTDLLPGWLGILGLAAIFSAEISTCDAVLFMLSTSLSVDVYRTYVDPEVSERALLAISRWAAVLGGALGTVVAILLPSIVAALTLFYSLVSVALFVPVVAGLYSRRPDARAALAAIVVSVPVTVLLHLAVGDRILGLNPFVIGMTASLLVLGGVTLATRR
jgi:SSS family solute:Na+ symporter